MSFSQHLKEQEELDNNILLFLLLDNSDSSDNEENINKSCKINPTKKTQPIDVYGAVKFPQIRNVLTNIFWHKKVTRYKAVSAAVGSS